ncbi:hypothetical protein ACQEU6_44445 [Spirillospora sp. CA-108201]
MTETFSGAPGSAPGRWRRGSRGAVRGGCGAPPSPGRGMARRPGPPGTLSRYLSMPLRPPCPSITTARGPDGSFAHSRPSRTKTSSVAGRPLTGTGSSNRLPAGSYTSRAPAVSSGM